MPKKHAQAPTAGHAHGYSVSAALDLARTIRHGPLPKADDPVPTPADALTLIDEARRECGFNWITGEVAASVLRAYIAGALAGRTAPCPHKAWSDEYKAWHAGRASRTPEI